ncbi:MAG: tripartite tricarboxylate transporter TctB family protein [Clostridia bacterium]|nr:tripartite tricarboxylate transporter TctB family protein [Clostridia bacterium]
MRRYLKNAVIWQGFAALAASLALAAYSVFGFYGAAVRTEWLMSPYLFPLVLSALALLPALALLAEGRAEARRRYADEPSGEREGATTTTHAYARRPAWTAALAVAACALYVALMELITFIPATALFLFAALALLGERRWWLNAVISLGAPLALYALFELALRLRLP